MATEDRQCAKCGHVQPLVVCFDCIDAFNTKLSVFKTLPESIPVPPTPEVTLQPMNGFMPLDVVSLIAGYAVKLPLEPHERPRDRYTRMSMICKRTRATVPRPRRAPQLTAEHRKKLHRIFYNIARSTRDRAEWSVDRFTTKTLGLNEHRAYTAFSWYWINLDPHTLHHTWLYHILQLSKSCHRIKCHTLEIVHR